MSDEIGSTVEVWKTIPDYPKYSVSNFGRVKRVRPINSTRSPFIKPRTDPKGYFYAELWESGKAHRRWISRLVAFAFLDQDPNPERNEVNHKNGIKKDNRHSNLEWTTHLENVRHAISTGLTVTAVGEAASKAKLTESEVRDIREMLANGMRVACVARLFGVHFNTLRAIKVGRTWKHVV